MVICLERGADLHMAQLMPLPLTVSCFSKIQIGLPFWYWLTRVVPENGPLNVCVCVCVVLYLQRETIWWHLCIIKDTVKQGICPWTCARDAVLGSGRDNIRYYVMTFAPPPHLFPNRLLVPSVKLSTVGGRAFPVTGPTIWNSLPDNVISAPSLSTFRQHLKTFLFQASFPDIIIDPR